jgi:hypothetical protein
MQTKPTSRDASRTSREQPQARDTSRDREVEINLSLDDTGPVPQDIEPRDGYENQWLRVMAGNVPDARNVMMMERQGWQPVDPSKISKSYAHMLVQNEKLGNVIGTHDLVLFERPKKYGDAQRKMLKERVQEKTRAIQTGLRQELSGTGMNYLDDSQANLDVGRRAEVAPD